MLYLINKNSTNLRIKHFITNSNVDYRVLFITNLKGGDRMKIKVTTAFNDLQNGCITRPVNEVFECTEEREKELISLDYAERVEDEQPKGKLAKTKVL